MKERPILFSAPMVRALLDGSKTQTRRIVKELDPEQGACTTQTSGAPLNGCCWRFGGPIIYSPYGQPGDRLWVRETWQTHCDKDAISPADLPRDSHIQYPATYDGWVSKRRPSIHMPRWASRIPLEIVSVRVERLNDISEEDARAEGVKPTDDPAYFGIEGVHIGLNARESYSSLWEAINGAGSVEANPFVWAVEFKRVTS